MADGAINGVAGARASFDQQAIMAMLDAQVHDAKNGRVTIRLPYRKDLCQQDGFVHAGILTTIMDSAGGYAGYTLMPEGSRVLAVEFKVNFLRPAVGEWFEATGEVVKAGKTLTVCDLTCHAVNGGQATLVAKGMQTLICIN